MTTYIWCEMVNIWTFIEHLPYAKLCSKKFYIYDVVYIHNKSIDSYYYYSQFTEKETEAQRTTNLPQITQLANVKAGIDIHAICIRPLLWPLIHSVIERNGG